MSGQWLSLEDAHSRGESVKDLSELVGFFSLELILLEQPFFKSATGFSIAQCGSCFFCLP